MEENLKEIIFSLESEFQKPEVRKSAEKLGELISDDFCEITSSGLVTSKKDCLVNLPKASEIKFVMTGFRINVLSLDMIQTFFKTEKTVVETGKVSYSMRSSIWKNENGKWRMIFHQGTSLDK
jgi:hypothetical protein